MRSFLGSDMHRCAICKSPLSKKKNHTFALSIVGTISHNLSSRIRERIGIHGHAHRHIQICKCIHNFPEGNIRFVFVSPGSFLIYCILSPVFSLLFLLLTKLLKMFLFFFQIFFLKGKRRYLLI